MAVRGPGGRPSADELQTIFAGWKAGLTLQAVGERVGRPFDAVYRILLVRGGLPPRDRRRSPRALALSEREEISRGVAHGESLRAIARRLGRAPSTISREVARHGGREGYRAAPADERAWARACRPKACRLATDAALRRVVRTKLQADWSPQQIAAWLRHRYPTDPRMWISHETIYRTLYVQARGALKRELTQHLRRGHVMRRSNPGVRAKQGRARIVDAVSIAERPASADDRAVPGHWEGDLLAGNKQSNIATLVERSSRYVLLVRLPQRDAVSVAKALARRVQRLPASLKQSLTWDRGFEMAQHQQFTVATNVQVYFCDPRSPWQRGSNENTNGLLRQYFPKGMDLSGVTQRQLDAVALRLNTRPRQTLQWRSPAEALADLVASTG